MARPQDTLADGLRVVKSLQDAGRVAIRSQDLKRDQREALLRGGHIQRVIKGWYVPARPDEQPGESTAWYASFWGFCASYLDYRFGEEWTLSPEQSALLYGGSTSVPQQLLVRSPKASNNTTELVHGTSILEVKGELPAAIEREAVDGLRQYTLAGALISSGPRIYRQNPIDMRAALGLLQDASQVLPVLLEGGHTTAAGRLAGAVRSIGRDRIADNILKAMRAAGYTVNESNPFEDDVSIELPQREHSPYVNRMHGFWQSMRTEIIEIFSEPPGITEDAATYLKTVEDAYATDAYHSLSIEGYRVTEELIERVRSGSWNPDQVKADLQQRDAMAARGYWLAFQEVKESVARVLAGENPGDVSDSDHSGWFVALFTPSVEAGILERADLAGYRNDQVYIRNSMHTPPKSEEVLDCMAALFDLLREEEHAAVRTVMGHWLFGYIHPYMDGNGRIGRFLMNVLLASGGYPWTVITIDRRDEYMAALEEASVKNNIKPLAEFLASLLP